jgi:KAP-like P-loop domain-containing protein
MLGEFVSDATDATSVPMRLAGPLTGPIWALAAAALPGGTIIMAGGSQGKVAWWNAATGDLLAEASTTDRGGVVRAAAALTLPDGRARFATAGSRGTVQLWDGASGAPVGEPIVSESGIVWSMAFLAVPGQGPVLFTGDDEGLISRWDPESGERAGEPFGDHSGAVRAMAEGPPRDGTPTLVTGSDDTFVRRWDVLTGQRLGRPPGSGSGQVWGLTAAMLPDGRPIVVSCANNGVLCRWDDTGERLGSPVVAGVGALTAVVAVTLPNGRVSVVSAGADSQLSCWDAETGAPVGRPMPVPGGSVNSLITVPGPDDRVQLVYGDGGGGVTVAPVPWGTTLEPHLDARAQVDATHVQDGLGRRLLATHLAELLSQLADDSYSTSAVVHIDGRWGAGKSTLVRLLLEDEQAHGPDWIPPVVVDYEAWRECAIAPEWWSLAAAIAREVRHSRSWLTRAFMLVWSLAVRTKRSPASLTALAMVVVGLVLHLTVASSWVQTAGVVAAAVGGLVTVGQMIGRTLFWHSAPFGQLHLRTEDNPLGQVADMIGWLRHWAPRARARQAGPRRRRPILLVIDDLDRCPAERVVKILETTHTILRHPPGRNRLPRRREPARLFVLVLADGRWVRQAFASRFAEFEGLGSTTHDLGSDFTQKLFDHVVLVPDVFARQVSPYLDRVVGARIDGAADRSGMPAEPSTQAGDDGGSQEDRASGDTGRPARDQDRAEIEQVRREGTAEETDRRSDHLLHTYADLMPPNPRMIKRIANALGMLSAIRTHVGHAEDDDTMARAAILLIRFPVLATRLRIDDQLGGTDPCWRLPPVRNVLGGRRLDSLARCLGRADPPDPDEGPAITGSGDATSAPRSPDPA